MKNLSEKNEEKRLKEFDKREYEAKKKKLRRISYLVKLFVIVFILTVGFSFVSSAALDGVGTAVAVIVILIIALIGILFDIVGVATTSADTVPFNAMASRKIRGAKTGSMLIQNADKVSSLCNDVIGDMSGIISGSAGSALSVRLVANIENPAVKIVLPLVITAITASVVIVGKATGKSFAIRYSNEIVFRTARIIAVFKRER